MYERCDLLPQKLRSDINFPHVPPLIQMLLFINNGAVKPDHCQLGCMGTDVHCQEMVKLRIYGKQSDFPTPFAGKRAAFGQNAILQQLFHAVDHGQVAVIQSLSQLRAADFSVVEHIFQHFCLGVGIAFCFMHHRTQTSFL